jgi:REP element-mobilizing transposase RayT
LYVVFSTKNRAPFLQSKEIRDGMNGYMVGTLQGIGCPSLIVRSVEDHIHCLCQLSRTKTIAALVEAMKVESSSWAKKHGPGLRDFYWQSGYGAFSVSQSNVEQVKEYIANQEEHHRKVSFHFKMRCGRCCDGTKSSSTSVSYGTENGISPRWGFRILLVIKPRARRPGLSNPAPLGLKRRLRRREIRICGI